MNTNPDARRGRWRRGPLLLVIVCALCVAAVAVSPPPGLFLTGARGAGQRDVNQAEAEALVVNARAAVGRMPPESRLEAIEDARLRRASQATYRTVAELAESREAGATPALYAKFVRAYPAFEAEAARRGHATCALNCKADDEASCLKDCKTPNRKLCGCKLITFGCVVAECLF